MAVLTVNTVDRAGFDLTAGFANAAGGGDSFPNTGVELVAFKNTDGTAVTVTLDIQALVDGQTVTDKTVVIGATTGEKLIGPFPTTVYNDGNSRVNFTYSGVTALKVCVFKPTTT